MKDKLIDIKIIGTKGDQSYKVLAFSLINHSIKLYIYSGNIIYQFIEGDILYINGKKRKINF